MKTYILKNKHCFHDKSRPYYGVAGDAYIVAIVFAESPDEALKVTFANTYYPSVWVKDEDEHRKERWEDFLKRWTITEYKLPTKKGIDLLVYGEY